MYLPNDMVIRKNIIYLFYHDSKDKMIQKPLIEVYNNTSYELINFKVAKPHGIRVADPITQIRFLYINIWTTIIAQKIYGLEFEKFQAHIRHLIEILKFYRKNIDIYTTKKNYFGNYVDLNINKKIMLLDAPQTKSNFKCFEV
jgi:hypothetical protein